jgi:ketose-bisphosphate aldolase
LRSRPFDAATVAAAKGAAEATKAGTLLSVAGGGDTVSALNHAGVSDDFTYVSTAGGAFLEWLEGKTACVELFPHIPVCMHQDHGNSAGTCMTAIQAGFTSVMMDGSLEADGKTPASWDYNVGVTKQVTMIAHLGGASVEGELGVLGSLETGTGEAEDGHGAEGELSHDQLLTDPDEAVRFVAETKVDALAIAMGTSHGAYKFTRKPDGDILAMNVIEEINQKLPNTHLVMHGSPRFRLLCFAFVLRDHGFSRLPLPPFPDHTAHPARGFL